MSRPEELIRLMEKEIDVLRRKLSLIERMSASVRDGAFGELEDMLKQATDLEEENRHLTGRIGRVCRRMAESRGLSRGEATLGGLLEHMRGKSAVTVSEGRERLMMLVEKLRQSGAALTTLVENALDINERLLAAVLGGDDWLDTYGTDARVEQRGASLSFQHMA